MNPKIVLYDEPTSGLDPKAGREFVRLLESLRDEGKAILMSTHQMHHLESLCDRIVLIDEFTRTQRQMAS